MQVVMYAVMQYLFEDGIEIPVDCAATWKL